MNTVLEISLFLLQFVGGMAVIFFLLRFLLQLSRASFYNPLAQAIYKATQVPVNTVGKALPPYRSFNTASLALALTAEFIIIIASIALAGGSAGNLLYPALWTLIGVASMTLNLYFYGIFVVVIVSWVAPHTQHPAVALIWQLVEPVTAPVRRLIPPMGGLDLSTMGVLLIIMVVRIALRNFAAATYLPLNFVPGI